METEINTSIFCAQCKTVIKIGKCGIRCEKLDLDFHSDVCYGDHRSGCDVCKERKGHVFIVESDMIRYIPDAKPNLSDDEEQELEEGKLACASCLGTFVVEELALRCRETDKLHHLRCYNYIHCSNCKACDAGHGVSVELKTSLRCFACDQKLELGSRGIRCSMDPKKKYHSNCFDDKHMSVCNICDATGGVAFEVAKKEDTKSLVPQFGRCESIHCLCIKTTDLPICCTCGKTRQQISDENMNKQCTKSGPTDVVYEVPQPESSTTKVNEDEELKALQQRATELHNRLEMLMDTRQYHKNLVEFHSKKQKKAEHDFQQTALENFQVETQLRKKQKC